MVGTIETLTVTQPAALKAKYNNLLKRQRLLETFLDNAAVPIAKREAKLPEFRAVLAEMNRLLFQIVEAGYILRREEVLEGFGEKV